MNAQNQSKGEFHKAKGKAKETAENSVEGLGKTVGGLTEGIGKTAGGITAGLGGTAGQAEGQRQQEQQAGQPPAGETRERGIGELIKSIRDSTDRFAENVRASAKSEMIIAGLLKEIDENINKLADEVRGNAKREVAMAGFIRDIRETTDRLAEETRESPGVTEKQGIQQPQQLQQTQQGEQQPQQPQQPQQAQQTPDTEGKSTGEARVPSGTIDQAMETTGGTLEEYYRESAEGLRKEVVKTAKRMRRGIQK